MENILENKKILLGVTGSIAAYKSQLLIRELVKLGADVHVILTPSALNFVTKMTTANLSKNQVLTDMFDESAQSGGAWHIELVHSCDLMIIAPCSAATIGKIANGICDNALSTLAVALPEGIPFLVAPAMDYSMFQHPTTQRNLKQLESDGAIIIPPAEGELSSGLVGPGRLPDTNVLMDYILKALNIAVPEEKKNPDLREAKSIEELVAGSSFTLMDAVEKDKWNSELELSKLKQSMGLEESSNLKGKKLLITAGPTVEKIDDVRFISNFSSGRMGLDLAEAGISLGMDVTLILGPVSLVPPKEAKLIKVTTAEEMFDAAVRHFPESDFAVLSAAVADFSPKSKQDGKIKKGDIGDSLNIELVRTKDILKELGKMKKAGQRLAGFALESSDEIENGWKKMKDKNCDMIVVNSVSGADNPFGSENNQITILTSDGRAESFPKMSKRECAFEILKRM